MPDIIETIKEKYATNQAECLNMLPELFRMNDEGLVKVLPENTLESIKLLTITSICYQKILDMIMERIKDSEDVSDLFLHIPTVQYTSNHLKLMQLARSGIDVNKIQSVNEVVNILYPREEAKKALNPVAGITTTEQRSVNHEQN